MHLFVLSTWVWTHSFWGTTWPHGTHAAWKEPGRSVHFSSDLQESGLWSFLSGLLFSCCLKKVISSPLPFLSFSSFSFPSPLPLPNPVPPSPGSRAKAPLSQCSLRAWLRRPVPGPSAAIPGLQRHTDRKDGLLRLVSPV